jgi:2-oxoglutarate dehydrogenase complex dehydrogenase (E1) component-like enzyme
MTPKSLLRTKESFSPADLLSEGAFLSVIPDETVTGGVRRVILCSGKIYYDLARYRAKHEIDDVAVVRVELLYPFPADRLRTALEPYGETDLVWVQEEPANMGAWRFMSRYLFVEAGRSSRGIYRKESASPATGNAKTHVREQRELVEKAFA